MKHHLKHMSPVSKGHLSVFVAVFVVIGGLVIWRSFAAHINTDGAAPTYNLEAGAGDSSSSASIDGNDSSGSLNITAGNNTTAGKVISVTFNKPFAKAPRVILSAGNDQAANAKYYVQSTATGFTINVIDPLASGANLQFNYFVIQ